MPRRNTDPTPPVEERRCDCPHCTNAHIMATRDTDPVTPTNRRPAWLALAITLHDSWRRGADGVRFQGITRLSGADLSGADLSGANLSCANLTGADLSGANLSDAALQDSNMNGANLSGANLSDACLDRVILTGANLDRVIFRPQSMRDLRIDRSDMDRLGIVSCEDCNHLSAGGACYFCDQYLRHCEECSEDVWIDGRETYEVVGGAYFCISCFSQNYTHCSECEHVASIEDADEDGRCRRCVNAGRRSTIRSYTDRTANRLGPFGKGPLFFGVELEVENRGDDEDSTSEKAAICLDRIGRDFAVCKYDGSLNNGFEIVTAPSEVLHHRERFKRLLSTRIEGLRSWKTSTCGMHVHISRKALTPLTIGKMLVFVNETANSKLVHGIAGRKDSHYCQVMKKKVTDATVRGDRYEAINLTNEHTIEVRIFKGTLLYEGVMRNIEFCQALVQYASTYGLGDMNIAGFCRFIAFSPREWPCLSMWLRAHDFIPKPRVNRNSNAPQAAYDQNQEL